MTENVYGKIGAQKGTYLVKATDVSVQEKSNGF